MKATIYDDVLFGAILFSGLLGLSCSSESEQVRVKNVGISSMGRRNKGEKQDDWIIKNEVAWFIEPPNLPLMFAESDDAASSLSDKCRKEIELYRRDLRNATLWAVRSEQIILHLLISSLHFTSTAFAKNCCYFVKLGPFFAKLSFFQNIGIYLLAKLSFIWMIQLCTTYGIHNR